MTTAVADHVVAKVLESRSFRGKYGEMMAYDLILESGDVAEVVQKPSTPAPQVGDVIHGQIREEYGKMKLKKITPGFEDKDAKPATMANTSMGSAPLRVKDEKGQMWEQAGPPTTVPLPNPNPHALPLNGDARQWSIVRQHSQAMAIEMVRAMIYLNVVAGEMASMAMVRRLTDWFQADAEGKNPPDYTP